MLTIQSILVPADFSGCSHAAFRVAAALARDHRARLVVLHVATPPPFVTPWELEKALSRPEGYRRELEDMLREGYTPHPPTGVEYRVGEGDPAAEILAAAREHGCGLIVMGTHGRTGVGRVLLGSVAEAVLRRAPCPVLTVRGAGPKCAAPEGREAEAAHS